MEVKVQYSNPKKKKFFYPINIISKLSKPEKNFFRAGIYFCMGLNTLFSVFKLTLLYISLNFLSLPFLAYIKSDIVFQKIGVLADLFLKSLGFIHDDGFMYKDGFNILIILIGLSYCLRS